MKKGSCTAHVIAVLVGLFAAIQAESAALPEGGKVYLKLGSPDEVEWIKDGTSVKQSIRDKREVTGASKDACALDLQNPPELLAITSPQNKTVGFNNQKNWIGIREQSRGVDCGRLVGPTTNQAGQQIRIALGTALSPGNVVTHTKLSINAKKNAVIRAVLSGGDQTREFTLKTGLAATGTANPPTLQFCNAGISDSSPDSSANCPPWEFDGQWTSITFYTDAGEWSFAGPTSSEFTLTQFSGLLGCDPTNQTITEITGANGLTSSGYRLDNVADFELEGGESIPACVVVPYVYTAECPTGLTLPANPVCTNFVYDPLDQGTHMAFYFEWNWPPEDVPPGNTAEAVIDKIPETLQFFLNGSSVGVKLDICPNIRPIFEDPNNTPTDPTDDVFAGIDPDPAYAPPDLEPSVPGTQAGCLITRQVIQNGTDVLVIEGAYVQGDYVGSRSVGTR